MQFQFEKRSLKDFGEDETLEVRVASDDQPRRLVGYAAVFGSLSKDLGGFKERIQPGAFRESLASGDDIRALVGHDPSQLLGRTSNGTLRLTEDDIGLRVEIDLPNTSYANDQLELVRRRDVRAMSFGFKIRGMNGQSFTRENGLAIRDLRNVILKEVSPTPNPAYSDTDLQLRVDPEILEQVKALKGDPEAIEKIFRPKYARSNNILRTSLLRG